MHIPKYWTNNVQIFIKPIHFTLNHKNLKHDCLLTSIFNFLLDIIDINIILISGVDHYFFKIKKNHPLRIQLYFLISYW